MSDTTLRQICLICNQSIYSPFRQYDERGKVETMDELEAILLLVDVYEAITAAESQALANTAEFPQRTNDRYLKGEMK